MSEHFEVAPRRSWGLYAWIIIPAVLIVGFIVVTYFRGTERNKPDITQKSLASGEPTLVAVRKTLDRHADITACRTAVSQLNTHLQRTKTPEPLPSDKIEQLKGELTLDEGDVAEMNSPLFTSLDAGHLASCLLLRDVAKSLELVPLSGRKGKPVTIAPLERARLAFDWVCRQVVLVPPPTQPRLPIPEVLLQPAPPDFVLRRGTGSALERALVFVALIEQFGLQDEKAGLQGCLLFTPARGKQVPDLWACGVVPGDQPDVMYLFDPRLGLALPGPDGKGIATLKEARENPAILGQLKFDDVSYDVSADRAKTAEAAVFVPITALSPRMRLLQDTFLREPHWEDEEGKRHNYPPPVRVKLAEDEPGALAAVRAAMKASGGSETRYWSDGANVLRRFTAKEEGGSDEPAGLSVALLRGFARQDENVALKIKRKQAAELLSVPWDDFPVLLRESQDCVFNSPVGQRVREYFASPFLRWLQDSRSPRELLLRGQPERALPDLVSEQPHWTQARDRIQVRLGNEREFYKGVNAWLAEAANAHAELQGEALIARLKQLYSWRPGEHPMDILLNGALAEPRGAQVTYLLALTKHEQAVKLRERADLAERGGVKRPEDDAKARDAWEQTEYWWKQFAESYARRPTGPMARRLLYESHMAMGKREEAVRALGDLSEGDDLDRVARRWLTKLAK